MLACLFLELTPALGIFDPTGRRELDFRCVPSFQPLLLAGDDNVHEECVKQCDVQHTADEERAPTEGLLDNRPSGCSDGTDAVEHCNDPGVDSVIVFRAEDLTCQEGEHRRRKRIA